MDNNYKTYRDLVESIITLLDRQGFPTKDTRFSHRLVYQTILDMRTSYLKRKKTVRQGIGYENVQTITCLSLEEIDKNLCPCNPPTGCHWLKSTKPIPKSVFITSVTNSTSEFKADFVEWSQMKNKILSRSFKPNIRYFTILDVGDGPYLYLFNDTLIQNVALTGIWENPNHAAYFTSCNDESERQKFLRCSPLDTPLYMDGDTTDVVFKMTFDFLARSTQASTVDIQADSLDNAGQVQNKTT